MTTPMSRGVQHFGAANSPRRRGDAEESAEKAFERQNLRARSERRSRSKPVREVVAATWVLIRMHRKCLMASAQKAGLQGRIDGWKVRRGLAGRSLLAPVFRVRDECRALALFPYLGIRLWEPLDPVVQVVRRPVRPNEKQPFDCGSDGSGRRNHQDSRRFVGRNEAVEMDAHGSENCARGREEVYRGLSPEVLSECRDRCRRRLESGSSSEPWLRFFPGPLKTVDHFLRHGILRLDLFEDAVLIFQVSVNVRRVLQY